MENDGFVLLLEFGLPRLVSFCFENLDLGVVLKGRFAVTDDLFVVLCGLLVVLGGLLVILDVCLDVLDGALVVLTGIFFFCVLGLVTDPMFKKLVCPFFKEGLGEEEKGAGLEGGGLWLKLNCALFCPLLLLLVLPAPEVCRPNWPPLLDAENLLLVFGRLLDVGFLIVNIF